MLSFTIFRNDFHFNQFMVIERNFDFRQHSFCESVSSHQHNRF
ncbi:Uncharacterised protein [Vibrio cholerae]|nr:Uncharacterised protein [Vibrio cholerae]